MGFIYSFTYCLICLVVDVPAFIFSEITMDQVMQLVDPAKQFAKDSLRLVKRCTKPDRKGNVPFHHLL